MKCDKCGTVDERGPHTSGNCNSVLDAQLASMTKRAEEAEAKLAIEHEANQHDPVRLKLVAAEAKLAAAVLVLKQAEPWANEHKIFYQHISGPGCASDVLHGIGKAARATLRDIGVEPGEVGR